MRHRLIIFAAIVICLAAHALRAAATTAPLDAQFSSTIRPFLEQYCVKCHGRENPEGDLDLAAWSSPASTVKDSDRWSAVLEKLEAGKMPPRKAKLRPSPEVRRQVIEWFHAATDFQTRLHAGDPGMVPARRLSAFEYDCTIRDLTGADIRPAAQFPVDPTDTAGFDNSGESLVMSPSLLKKYLQAAHEVADCLVLRPDGFVFASRPMLAETDRDTWCVQRIIRFYHEQDIDYADYFDAAWRYRNRAALGFPDATLADIAADRHVSLRYLTTVWNALENETDRIGPLAALQEMWRRLPAPDGRGDDAARHGCQEMRDWVLALRKKVEPRFLNITAGRVSTSSEPLLIWKNVQYATHRMTFDPAQLQVDGEPPPPADDGKEPGVEDEFGPGRTVLIHNRPGDPDLHVPAGRRAEYEEAFARFCRIFPDRFYMQERGRNYFDTTKDRGRYLSAGFHSLMGFFRDDQPLYELILSDAQRKELDSMWEDMDFVASTTRRTYIQFCGSGQRGERGISQTEHLTSVADQERAVTSEIRIRQVEDSYLRMARGGDDRGIQSIEYWFNWINDTLRRTEQARLDAEPAQLDALLRFAARADRRPLSEDERNDLLSWYRSCRKAGLDHEQAIRECVVSVLMSPDFCYRIDLMPGEGGIHPLTDFELASRLSYFLWSSMPDEKLLAHAAAGDLHEPRVLLAETRRMLADPRVRALAINFGGNWLDFRRFDEIATVDRDRFPTFTDQLRLAMYEEPVRFLVDAFQTDRSMLDLIYGNYTFVNPVLARHYGMPVPDGGSDHWVRIDDADRYGRGGLLPMAAFLTKNAPGLRTSPVKRGNWVVKNLLGERILPPPPNVPRLPDDESRLDLPLRDVLARHRSDPACAACHAKFDSFGLVFEGFGPIGERREKDLGGRAIDDSATFPDGRDESGVAGLRDYIRQRRQNDFVDNLCRKLLAYGLGRSLILSDDLLIRQIHDRLAADGYRLDTVIDQIVTSPQFLNKRGTAPTGER